MLYFFFIQSLSPSSILFDVKSKSKALSKPQALISAKGFLSIYTFVQVPPLYVHHASFYILYPPNVPHTRGYSYAVMFCSVLTHNFLDVLRSHPHFLSVAVIFYIVSSLFYHCVPFFKIKMRQQNRKGSENI